MEPITSRRIALLALMGLATAPSLARAGLLPKPARIVPTGFPDIGYSDWTEAEPHYRLYPGDQIDINVVSAPELSRSLTVQPDGRVSMPLIGTVMVADRAIPEIEDALTGAYASQLLRPEVQVTVKSYGALKVFVMGEVGTPGVYDMPGDINALQAIAQAGGLKPSARCKEIVVIRRGPGGQPLLRTANLEQALTRASSTDMVPLRRFDIVYVPRSKIAEAGLFVQQYLKDLQPFQLGFSYALNGVNR